MKILLICTGNMTRSLLREKILKPFNSAWKIGVIAIYLAGAPLSEFMWLRYDHTEGDVYDSVFLSEKIQFRLYADCTCSFNDYYETKRLPSKLKCIVPFPMTDYTLSLMNLSSR